MEEKLMNEIIMINRWYFR